MATFKVFSSSPLSALNRRLDLERSLQMLSISLKSMQKNIQIMFLIMILVFYAFQNIKLILILLYFADKQTWLDEIQVGT